MRVKMLTDAPGSPDGVTINEYEDGEVYNVTDELGAVFVDQGLARELDKATPSTTSKAKVEPRGADTGNLTKKQAAGPEENK